MIDIHTHLIPGIDDGCVSLEETVKVCEIMKRQGVDRIIATPHFYADSETPEEFVEKRDAAYEALGDIKEKYHIGKGAEVRYFTGMGMSEGIDMLRIENTGFLLLELPDRKVNDRVIEDLMRLRSRNFRPIIAHLNRYREFHNDGFIEFCNINSIPIQINTECLFAPFMRKRALGLIGSGAVQYLATDCHGCDRRRPNLGEAFRIVREYLGDEVTDDFMENEERIIYE